MSLLAMPQELCPLSLMLQIKYSTTVDPRYDDTVCYQIFSC